MLSLLPDTWRFVLSILIALLIGWYIRIPIFKLAIRKNFVDRPNNRSSHIGCVPNIGGIIVFLSFVVSCTLFMQFDTFYELQYILLGAILIFIIGIYDDFVQISPRKKLKGEILGVLALILGGNFYLDNLSGLFGMGYIYSWAGIILSFIALIGLINAINLLDGIDGLSSGVALCDSLFFGICLYKVGYLEYALLCFILAASIFPFFLINLFGNRSKMFMGDSGALMVGFLLGVMAIKMGKIDIIEWKANGYFAIPALIFSVLAVPILDTLRLFVSRWMRGFSPFKADKSHLHHKLLIIYDGVHMKATFTILVLNLMFICLGVIGQKMSNELLILLDIVLFSLMFYIINELAKRKLAARNNSPVKS